MKASHISCMRDGRSSLPDRVIETSKSPLDQENEKTDLQSDGMPEPIETQAGKQGRIRWMRSSA